MYFYALTVLFSLLAIIEVTVINVRRKKYENLLSDKKRILSIFDPFDIEQLVKQPTFKQKFKIPFILFLVFLSLAIIFFVLSFVF